MFGRIRKARKKRHAREKRTLEQSNQQQANSPLSDEQQKEAEKQQISQSLQEAKEGRQGAREEGVKWGEEFLNKPIEGLTPAERAAIQSEAHKGIKRQTQSAQRKLLGEQGMRGITGKSGVGFAQQLELQRAASDARGQVQRDIDKLNADVQNKKRAALYGIGAGEATQYQLDKQMIMDQLALQKDKEGELDIEELMNQVLNRI